MKILIIASKYFPAVGGLETAVNAISKKMTEGGHELSLITNRYARQLPTHEIIDGIPVERYYFTEGPPRFRNPWIWCKWIAQLFIAPVSFLKLIYHIRKFCPQIVHLHFVGSPTPYVLAAKLLLKFPLIVSLHGADVEGFERKSKLWKWIFVQAILRSDFLTANARHLLEEALLKSRIIKKNSKVVPMGFSFDVCDQVPRYAYPHPYIFAAGRFVHKKGFDVLIRAFSVLAQNKTYEGNLILAGMGEELEPCRKLVADLELNERVCFFGLADSKTIASLMKGCDLFIMPSRMEAFGIILLEALYAGRKVIASAVGGIPELMKDNPQQLVQPDNFLTLAEKISETLSGETQWKSISEAELKEKFNWSEVTENYLSIYSKILLGAG